MKLSDIMAWEAAGRPWPQGVALYAAAGPSATYKRLFALGETDYSRNVLWREMAAAVRTVEDEIRVWRPGPAPEPPAAALEPVVPTGGPDSPVVARLRTQLKAVRDERSHLHPQLTGKGVGVAGRLALAMRILELTDQEVKLKADEAHVLAHGRLPGRVPSAELADSGVLRQRLNNLLSLRSKLKKRPDRADDLAAAEDEITLIRSKLNPEPCLTN